MIPSKYLVRFDPRPVQAIYLTPQNVKDIADWCKGYVKYDNNGGLTLWYHSDDDHLKRNGPDAFDRVAPFGSWLLYDPVGGEWDWRTPQHFNEEFVPCPEGITDDVVASLAIQVNMIRNKHANDPDLDAVIVRHVLRSVGADGAGLHR